MKRNRTVFEFPNLRKRAVNRFIGALSFSGHNSHSYDVCVHQKGALSEDVFPSSRAGRQECEEGKVKSEKRQIKDF